MRVIGLTLLFMGLLCGLVGIARCFSVEHFGFGNCVDFAIAVALLASGRAFIRRWESIARA